MINQKLVSTLSMALCASMISIAANASPCENTLNQAKDTLAKNQSLSSKQKKALLEQIPGLKECINDGCQNYSWTSNCAYIRTLVNTPSASAPVTAPLQAPPAPPTQPEIKNTNVPTPSPLNNTSNQPTTTTPTTAAQPTNGTKNSETTSTTTPSNNSVNWF